MSGPEQLRMRALLQRIVRTVRPHPRDVPAGARPQRAAGSRTIVFPAGEDEAASLQALMAVGTYRRSLGHGVQHTLPQVVTT